MYSNLSETTAAYADTPEAHTTLWRAFTDHVQATPYLKEHRDFVENFGFGYGDRPFHWAWKLLVDALPKEFSFCEVGVFQGQVLSLIALIAQQTGKQAKVVGVTPLEGTGDKYATHPDMDYLGRIRRIHQEFLIRKSPIINKGMSYDPRVQRATRDQGPYDLVYVDGCHDYDVVVDDLNIYGGMVKPGGLLVVDDAGNNLKLPTGVMPLDWRGLEEVTQAVDEMVRDCPYVLRHLFAVGHLRVFSCGVQEPPKFASGR